MKFDIDVRLKIDDVEAYSANVTTVNASVETAKVTESLKMICDAVGLIYDKIALVKHIEMFISRVLGVTFT